MNKSIRMKRLSIVSAVVATGAEAIRALGKEQHVLYDIKYLLPADQVDGRL